MSSGGGGGINPFSPSNLIPGYGSYKGFKNNGIIGALDPADFSGNKATKDAVKASKEATANAEAAAAKQQADFADRVASEEAANLAEASQDSATQSQTAARRRQKALAAGASGRSSTILTSPLGVTAGANGVSKTILGQ